MIYMIYMAAGNSRRFGENENKLLFEIDHKPMYQHGLHQLLDICRSRKDCHLTVVTQFEEIGDYIRKRKEPIVLLMNPDSRLGASYTIKAAIGSILQKHPINPAEDYLFFMVADQPYMNARTLERLLDLADGHTETACVSYQDRPGNPALFSTRFLEEFQQLKEDEGGKKIMKNHSCIRIPVDSKRELVDIDYKNQQI